MKWGLLAGAVALAALGWSGWWAIGSAARDAALEAWLAGRRAAGWQAEAAGIATAGFPNRFDTRVTGLLLADPAQGWAWEAPFLDILGLSWEPNHVVVALAPEQRLSAPGETATLRSERLMGSLRFVPGPSLELSRLSVEGDGLALDAREGWRAGARRLAGHVVESDPATAPAHAYDLWIEAEAVTLPPALEALIDPTGALAPVFDRLTLDARAAFDAPLDRLAVEGGLPQATAVSLKALDARWGELALSARGLIEVDAEGYAEGRLDIRAENWREMLRAAVAAGALDPGLADALEAGLGFVAGFSGGGKAIDVPLTFENGWTKLGPVPVGPAPRLR